MSSTAYSRPAGFADHDSAATAGRRRIEARIEELFRSYGYQRITVPTVEYADLYSPHRIGHDLFHQLLVSQLSEAALFPADPGPAGEEPATGHRSSAVVLRPELTAQVARWFTDRLIANGGLPPRLPLRVAYAGQVFRDVEPAPGRLREFRQLGVELIGSRSRWADLELLCLASDAARELALPGWQLDLGHAALYWEILRSYGLEGERLTRVAAHVELAAEIHRRTAAPGPGGDAVPGDERHRDPSGDASLLAWIEGFVRAHRSRLPAAHPGVEEPSRLSAEDWRRELPALHDAYLGRLWSLPELDLPAATIDALLELARLSGRGEGFFARLEPFVRTDAVRRAGDELAWLARRLSAACEVEPRLAPVTSRGLNYYTGVTFEIHCPLPGSPFSSVCGGGRYDELHTWVYGRARATRRLRAGGATSEAAPASGSALAGIGLAFGLERLAFALGQAAETPSPHVLVVAESEEAQADAFSFAGSLRRRGIAAVCHLPRTDDDRSGHLAPAEQRRYAEGLGVPRMVIVGASGAGGEVELRDPAAESGRRLDAAAALEEIAAGLGPGVAP